MQLVYLLALSLTYQLYLLALAPTYRLCLLALALIQSYWCVVNSVLILYLTEYIL